jgi:DNA-binding transcriptional LysR family regulator
MLIRSQRAVANLQRFQSIVNTNRLSWDDLRVFLTCADERSFRKAAVRLKINSSTVMRRIERLESALGSMLFNRLPEGVELTDEGRSIVSSARDMENALFGLLRRHTSPEGAPRGNVTISITEGLGSYWLIPRLVEFQREHPFLIIGVNCAMTSADVLRMEADISVQFEKPTAPDLVTAKIASLHVYPFASREYINTYGMPNSKEDMLNHRLVDQSAPKIKGAWAKLLNIDSVEGIVGIRTNASTAVFYAIEKGAGIGGLPSYALALGASLVPVDIGIKHKLDVWLTYHPDTKKIPRKMLVIEWLKRIFSPEVYPWFGEEFIHPNDLVKLTPPDALVNKGIGYFSVTPFKTA